MRYILSPYAAVPVRIICCKLFFLAAVTILLILNANLNSACLIRFIRILS